MKLVLQTANTVNDATNCLYPNRVEVSSAEELQEAVKMDHVCAEYDNDYRSKENFKQSNVIVMDCDNDHTDDPAEWITPEKLDEMMPDISYAIAFSKHHMLEKNGRSPRPKYHVYFAIEPTTDADHYAAIKEAIYNQYPFFDSNALDAARFIFGADAGDAIWHDGWLTIDTEVDVAAVDFGKEDSWAGNVIVEGTRNKTLSRFAGRVIIRYGDSEKAHQVFLDKAAKCDPPLPEEELTTIWNSARRFGKKAAARDGYVPPEEYNSQDFLSMKPDDYSDIGEAKILAREYGNELRFTDSTDLIRYNGIYWQESKQMAIGAMMEFLDLQLEDAKDQLSAARQALLDSGVTSEDIAAGGKALAKAVSGEDQIKLLMAFLSAQQYYAFVMKHRDYKYVMSSLNQAKPLVLMDINQLDTNPYLLNTPEATYDLRHGLEGAQTHDPQDFLTRCTNAAPGEAGRDLWLDTVNRVFCGDPELIEYVQTIVGMAVVGKVFSESLIISYGDGANGKSTFWNTLARVLGNYSGMMSADALTVGCKRNVKPEMAELKGKRLIIAAELEEGMRLNTSTVKQLCSTDEIEAEKKYKDPFKYIPTHTLVLYTNHLPKVGASDDGTWRRLIVIPFNAKIQGKTDIKNYTDYLVDNASPYIMTWIIEGAKKAIDAGFKLHPPKCVQDAVNAYREGNDWLGHFLEECCEVGAGLEQKSGELYQEYRVFCMRTGEYTRSTTDFYKELESNGFSRKRRNDGRFVTGLKLKGDFLT